MSRRGKLDTVRSSALLAIRSEVEDVFDERVVTDHKQKAVTGAVEPPATIIAVADALLENIELIAPITTFVSD